MAIDNIAETRRQAEEIYSSWRGGEFDLDGAKAQLITYSRVRRNIEATTGKKGDKFDEAKTTLLDDFSNALNNYQTFRGFEGKPWNDAAYVLVVTHDTTRLTGCIIAGSATKRELQEKESKLNEVYAELDKAMKALEQAKQNADRLESALSRCNDTRIDAETKLAEKEKELSDIRGADIADSLEHGKGHIQSGVEPKDGGEKPDK